MRRDGGVIDGGGEFLRVVGASYVRLPTTIVDRLGVLLGWWPMKRVICTLGPLLVVVVVAVVIGEGRLGPGDGWAGVGNILIRWGWGDSCSVARSVSAALNR